MGPLGYWHPARRLDRERVMEYERLAAEAAILRREIAWHEEREPAYNPVQWAACVAGLRFRLRELNQHMATL